MSTTHTWKSCMDAYRLHLEALGRSPYTVRAQISVLRCFGRFANSEKHCACPLTSPNLPAIACAWIASLYGLYSRYSIRNYVLTMRSFYRWAVAEGRAACNPFDGLPVPKPHDVAIRPYSRNELRRFLRATTDSPRDQAILLLLIATGMRANELVHLEVADVDWGRGTILIRQGKGGKSRRVAPGQYALAVLRRYLETCRVHRGRLFPIRPDSLYHCIVRLGELAGIEGANVHRFRHSYAHEFLENGGDVGDLKVILGHSTITMSLRYAAYYAAERALESQKRLNPADRLFAGTA